VGEKDDPILESPIGQAHDLFDFSIFEVMDHDDCASGIMAIVKQVATHQDLPRRHCPARGIT